MFIVIEPHDAYEFDTKDKAIEKAKECAQDGRTFYVAEVIGVAETVPDPVVFRSLGTEDQAEKPAGRGRPKKTTAEPTPPVVTPEPPLRAAAAIIEAARATTVEGSGAVSAVDPIAVPKEPAPEPVAEVVPEGSRVGHGVAPAAPLTPEEEDDLLIRCKVGEDDAKCPRCGKGSIRALLNSKDVIRVCPDSECHDPEWDPFEERVAAATEELAKEEAKPVQGFVMPSAEDVKTTVSLLGMEVPMPPLEWKERKITNEKDDVLTDSRGQLIALNAGLTSIGYGENLRHPACEAILCKDHVGSLNDLTKFEAHLCLEWIAKATPQELAVLSSAVTRKLQQR